MPAVGAIGNAACASERRRRAQGEHLVVLGRHRAVAALDRVRRAILRLLDRLAVRTTGRLQRVGHAIDVGERASERGQRADVDVAERAATDPVGRGDDAVLRLGWDDAAPAIAERDDAGDVVERVVPAARSGGEEAVDALVADPALVVLRIIGQDGADRVRAEVHDLLGRGGLALAHLDHLVVQHRLAQELERLHRRVVGVAERLLADRLVIERIDRVRHDHPDARRLDVPALLEPGAQPVPLLGELARLRERFPLAAIPVLPDHALPALPGELPHRLVLAELGGGDAGLLARHRAQAELLVELEVEPERIVRWLPREAEVDRRRLLRLGRERLEDRELGARDLGDVGVLEVVERQREPDVAIIFTVAQRDRAQGRRPQRAIVLEDPLVALERVAALLAVVALLDPSADPALGDAVDLRRLHVLRTTEADRP